VVIGLTHGGNAAARLFPGVAGGVQGLAGSGGGFSGVLLYVPVTTR
jgi:hypothetical protein